MCSSGIGHNPEQIGAHGTERSRIAVLIAKDFACCIAVGQEAVEHLIGKELQGDARAVDGHGAGEAIEDRLCLRMLRSEPESAGEPHDFVKRGINDGHSEPERIIELILMRQHFGGREHRQMVSGGIACSGEEKRLLHGRRYFFIFTEKRQFQNITSFYAGEIMRQRIRLLGWKRRRNRHDLWER